MEKKKAKYYPGYRRERYLMDKEKYKEHYEKNKDKRKIYNESNADKIKEYQKQYREKRKLDPKAMSNWRDYHRNYYHTVLKKNKSAGRS